MALENGPLRPLNIVIVSVLSHKDYVTGSETCSFPVC